VNASSRFQHRRATAPAADEARRPQEPRMQSLTTELEPDTKFYRTEQPPRRLQIVHCHKGPSYEEKNAAAELGSRGVSERCGLYQGCAPHHLRAAGRKTNRARRHPWPAGTPGPCQYSNCLFRCFRLPIVAPCCRLSSRLGAAGGSVCCRIVNKMRASCEGSLPGTAKLPSAPKIRPSGKADY
jgi:hypothetical protein